MLPAVTSVSGLLGADNTDAIAPFAQLMPTLAGNIATASEFVYDPHVPTFSESTFAAIILLFHGREKLIQKRDNFFERPNMIGNACFHRWREIHVVDCDRVLVILDLF